MEITNLETLFERGLQASSLSDKQQTVLRVSLTLFSEQGFDRTTTSQIAEEAGVSAGTVFKQFKTKEAILAALLDPFIEQVVPMAATEFADQITTHEFATPQAFFEYILRDRIMFALQNQKQAKLLIQEIVHDSQLIKTIAVKVQALIAGSFGQKLQEFKNTGQLVELPVTRVIQFFIGTLGSYVLPRILMGTVTQLDVDQVSQEAAQFLLHGLTPNA
ncbi:TetR/AcrR family transcriptional regulator [Furfurilactobacillus siliginis]|uniref:TetR family transcriptional regulator n=1 Tax=Furfurilactobacillus siliginis TaxID=348151 RepID=A0A0R2LEV2_9LACO|nr:TetR/AcrR family transcriptional regulator [Furfurilactobacillus siliginis]KRN97111.1 transcriptional regulator, TetR family [Furfurilactobacillus siliginis]GEK29397.1 TetR family transcriptional regulator [Furfurilactobacillus siliginis]